MTPEAAHRRLTRVQVACALLLLLASAGSLTRAALLDPDVPLVVGDAGGAWIADPMPLHTNGMWIDRRAPRPRVFERRFELPSAPVDRQGPVTLRLRALGEVTLHWNDRPVDLGGRDRRRWRETTVVDVTPFAMPGENRLRAEVRSPDGAALLSLRIDGLPLAISTDEGWLAARQGDPLAPAIRTSDARRFAETLTLPAPGPSLRAHAGLLGALFAAGTAAALALRGSPRLLALSPRLATLGVAVFWTWLFAAKIVRIPAAIGFDAAGQVEYVHWIVEHRALPLASDGFSFYHPPLFHLVSAALVSAFSPAPGSVFEKALLVLPASLSAFGMALVAGALARRLVPGRPGVHAGAIVAAGLLPMNVVLGACVSNEALHALVSSLAIAFTVRVLLSDRVIRRDDLVLGALLGAALLAKYTSALLAPVLVGAVAVKRLFGAGSERAAGGGGVDSAIGAAASTAVMLALAGWLYLRNLLHFGDPFVWNLDADPARTWWQLPGFHTPGWFLRFGDAFVRPWFSGFRSLWDSLYTTLWGDGLLTGASGAAAFHGHWRLDLMAAGFVLAAPATVLLLLGWGILARRALRDPAAGSRIACSLLAFLPVLFLLSLVSVNLRLAQWSLGKSFYALCLTPLLALLLAVGFDALLRALPERFATLRAAVWGYAVLFGATIVLAFGS